MCFLTAKNMVDFSILTAKDSSGVHFNLITVNSVLAGFMFTALSLIIGLSNTETVMRLEKAHFMHAIYNNIVLGIIFSIVSIIISLIMIFIMPSIISFILNEGGIERFPIVGDIVFVFVPFFEITTLILAIGCFVLSVFDTRFIIKSVRKRLLKNTSSDEDMEKTLKKIKKNF
jgi:Fe2+ transport system protein B